MIMRATRRFSSGWAGRLRDKDPQLRALILREIERQRDSIDLIASENFTENSVLECLGTPTQNKYSEGQPGSRYYGGNDVIDEIELLCQQRALQLYGLDAQKWGVCVQGLSGGPANFCAYSAVLEPGERAMALKLSSGGHLSHGFSLPAKKVHVTSKLYEWRHYEYADDGSFDYDAILQQAREFRPKLLVSGFSAYPRTIDYARLRAIADDVGALLLFDMAHVSGLVAAGVYPDPFPHCHIVTSTTHKTLRGPRGSMIFALREHAGARLLDSVAEAVFPGFQGGPHNHTITALAHALHLAAQPQFAAYQRATLANARALCESLQRRRIDVFTGGTDNHLAMLDLKSWGIDGGRVEHMCNAVHITLNKNTLRGDQSALRPSGLRVGTPPMTTRECGPQHFDQIADFIRRAIELAVKHNSHKKMASYKSHVERLALTDAEVRQLKRDVQDFSRAFPYHHLDI